MALKLPSAVDVSFIKATNVSVTLELTLVAPGDAAADKYELQYREVADFEWKTASAALKTKRCTKGNLTPGTAYVFRARASGGGERWGPFGDETDTLYTTLPELPEEVSESLKVPSK
eukprot:7176358-Prymnesium_polylepis.1